MEYRSVQIVNPDIEVPDPKRRRFLKTSLGAVVTISTGVGLVHLLTGCEGGDELIDGEGTPTIGFAMVPTYKQTTSPFGVGHVRG